MSLMACSRQLRSTELAGADLARPSAIPATLAGPRVRAADVPEVSLRIAAGESAPAILLIRNVEDHLCTGRFRLPVDGIAIGNNQAGRLRFQIADVLGLSNQPA